MPGIDGSQLREWRRSKGWDVPETARQLRLVATAPVASRTGLTRMIYAWERGAHELTERYELLYRKLGFRPSGEELLGRGTEGSACEIGRTLNELAAQSVAFGQQAEVATVGSGTIEQLDDSIQRLSREYLTEPPLPLIRRAAATRNQVFALLSERQRLRYARDLYVVAVKCCAFLSWTSGDLGQLGAAAAEARTALLLAEEAGHPGAQGLAFCAMSKAAFWDGQYARAAELAQRGFECCPPNGTRTLLACQQADALRGLEAVQATLGIRRAYDAASQPDDLGGLFTAGPVRIANYVAGVHARACDPAAAMRAAATAVPVPGEQVGYGTAAQLTITTAIASLQMRQLDEAAERLAAVLAIPAGQRLATVTGRLSTLIPVLAENSYRSTPIAASLADEIRSYCETASSALALPVGKDGDDD